MSDTDQTSDFEFGPAPNTYIQCNDKNCHEDEIHENCTQNGSYFVLIIILQYQAAILKIRKLLLGVFGHDSIVYGH